jgi:hypothetical protein
VRPPDEGFGPPPAGGIITLTGGADAPTARAAKAQGTVVSRS